MKIGFERAQKLAFLVTAGVMWCGAAAAQPAPIVYAGGGGQGSAAPALTMSSASTFEANLPGGDDGSYGYGAQQRERRGAVIDVRRSGEAARTEPRAEPISLLTQDAPNAQDDRIEAQGQGAQAWLEQERVGPPYEANGQTYVPTPEPGYSETGQASWYGPTFHGQATASGEMFDQTALSAAHPTLPIPSLVQITNLENGREVIVRVNDRGPFVGGRLIDVSQRTAEVLGFQDAGQARVHVRYLGPAPRHVSVNGADQPAPVVTPAPAPQSVAYQGAPLGPVSLLPPGASSAPAPVVAPMERPMERPVLAVENNIAPAMGGFMVQVGAFADLDNAHRVQAALADVGQVTVDARQTARGELFRVRVGPWGSRGEAEAARRQIADLGFGDAVLAAR